MYSKVFIIHFTVPLSNSFIWTVVDPDKGECEGHLSQNKLKDSRPVKISNGVYRNYFSITPTPSGCFGQHFFVGWRVFNSIFCSNTLGGVLEEEHPYKFSDISIYQVLT